MTQSGRSRSYGYRIMTSQNDNPVPLGIGRTLALSIYFFGKNFLPIIGLLAQLLVVVIGLVILTSLPFDLKPYEVPILTDLVIFIAFAPISIAVHRAIVLQEPIEATKYFSSFLQKRVWQFAGFAVLYAVPVGMGARVEPLVAVPIAAYLFGFSYVFPAVAVDEFQSLARSRKLMQGSMWRVFWCFLIVNIPFIIILKSVIPIAVSGAGIAAVFVFGIWFMLLPILMPAILSVAYKNSTRRVRTD